VQAVNGLREFPQVKRKRIPGDILFEADRLECQLFAGYDPVSTAMSLPDYESYSRQIAPARANYSILRDYSRSIP
jgi:hypothetical protein